MNLRTVLAAAGIMAALGLATTPARAQYPTQSNVNLYQVAGDISTAIMTLQRDQPDYDGHRIRAIGHLRQAHNQLRAAERWAQVHGYGYAQPISPAPPPYHGVYGRYAQGTSDRVIVDTARNVPNLIAQLRGDARDYGGRRLAAIRQLELAEDELNMAIAWFNAHGGM